MKKDSKRKQKQKARARLLLNERETKEKIFKEEKNHVKPYSRESVQILLLGGQIKE